MRLVWREFRVCLPKLDDLLATSVPSADGIIATPLACYVVEKTPFTEADMALVQGYWDGLSQQEEQDAFTARELAEVQKQRQALRETLQSLLQETQGD